MNSSPIADLDRLLSEGMVEIANAGDSAAVEHLRVALLGRQGTVTAQLKQIGVQPAELRREFGAAVNRIRDELSQALTEKAAAIAEQERRAAVDAQRIDVTLPGRKRHFGSLHPVTRTLRRIEQIFTRAGFDVAYGPEIEDDFHNFEALNIPKNHPARAMHDTLRICGDRPANAYIPGSNPLPGVQRSPGCCDRARPCVSL